MSGVTAASAVAYWPCTCSRVKMERRRLRQCASAAARALLAAFSCRSLHSTASMSGASSGALRTQRFQATLSRGGKAQALLQLPFCYVRMLA